MEKTVRLILESGREFLGKQFAGPQEDVTGELVFNTAMAGYQEVLTDPSYASQIVLMTYPLMGNYGINLEDVESRGLFLSALMVREYCDFPSNWRSQMTLKQYLDQHNVMGVTEFDTRAITRHIREKGAQKSLLTCAETPLPELVEQVRRQEGLTGVNTVKSVSSPRAYDWAAPESAQFKVAVIDCGVKQNILRHFQARHCQCEVLPYDVDPKKVLSGAYDGVFLSNGPGDPEPVTSTIRLIEAVLGKLPLFGICLGHQLLGLALGGKTYKLKFGHHGVNHPVKNLKTGAVEITSQNHGFCLDTDSFSDPNIETTHINLYDGTNEGIRHKTLSAFSVQYHPESAPGPHDSHYLFDEFIQMMGAFKQGE